MTAKLTDEMRTALAANPGQPLPVVDETDQRVYYLVESPPSDAKEESLKQNKQQWREFLDNLETLKAEHPIGSGGVKYTREQLYERD